MKKWFFIGMPVLAAIVFLLFPGIYKENFMLFGMFLVWPVYLSWLPVELAEKYGENVKKAYLLPAAALLLYEMIYLLSLKTLDLSVNGIVTLFLPWFVFTAGIVIWKLISLKKYILSLIPALALFFVAALKSIREPMLLTLSTVFAYISISLISLFYSKFGGNDPERIKSAKSYTLVMAIMMVLITIFAVSNMK